MRRPHPAFEDTNRWLQSLRQQTPATFDDLLSLVEALHDMEYGEGRPGLVRDGDAMSFRLGWADNAVEVFRQERNGLSLAAWVSRDQVAGSIQAVNNELENLKRHIMVFNRTQEREALQAFEARHPQIIIYPADQDFALAMPEPRAFFEAAELRELQVVIDRRSSMVLECGADQLCREEKVKRMIRRETGDVIARGWTLFAEDAS